MNKFKCKECRKTFKSLEGSRVFCSIACYKVNRLKNRISHNCCNCGVSFIDVHRKKGRKNINFFCCRICWVDYVASHRGARISDSRMYKVWTSMKQRCKNKKHNCYPRYGGRGIRVCKSWIKFKNFYNDMKNGYKDGLTLERIDNNLGYSKSNCKWATRKEQARNRSGNKLIKHNNQVKNLSEWAEINKINVRTLQSRLRRGICFADAINLPIMGKAD